jgi:hypothetical protein
MIEKKQTQIQKMIKLLVEDKRSIYTELCSYKSVGFSISAKKKLIFFKNKNVVMY